MEVTSKSRKKGTTAKGSTDLTTKSTRVDIRFDNDLYQLISELAETNSVSFGGQVKLILKDYLKELN